MQHEESDQGHVREVKREANKLKYFKVRKNYETRFS